MTAKKGTPKGLSEAGARLWRSVVDVFELDEHEAAVLLEAARTVDQLNALQVVVDRDGVVVDSPQGSKANPALVEARQQRIALARLVATLRLPDEETSTRPQRRGGARGLHAVKGSSA